MIEGNLNWQSHCTDIIKDYSFFSFGRLIARCYESRFDRLRRCFHLCVETTSRVSFDGPGILVQTALFLPSEAESPYFSADFGRKCYCRYPYIIAYCFSTQHTASDVFAAF